jgi:hypothetical protein
VLPKEGEPGRREKSDEILQSKADKSDFQPIFEFLLLDLQNFAQRVAIFSIISSLKSIVCFIQKLNNFLSNNCLFT